MLGRCSRAMKRTGTAAEVSEAGGARVWRMPRRPPSPTLPPQTARGKGASPVRHTGLSAQLCHPEPQARSTYPYNIPRGAKDLAWGTSKPGRGSGHPCRGRGVGGDRWLRRTPRLPSPPAPLPQAGEGRIRLRFGRLCCVQVKPRAGRDSDPSRGFPPFERRVHPLQGGDGAFCGSRALRLVCGGSLGRCCPCRTGRFAEAAPRDDSGRRQMWCTCR